MDKRLTVKQDKNIRVRILVKYFLSDFYPFIAIGPRKFEPSVSGTSKGITKIVT